MVFYRKYRPQTIEELDSVEVREKLYSVVSSDSIPHAFLFTGPKGLGKTSAARIVAKAVNCERKLKVENGKLKVKDKKNSQISTLNSQLNTVDPCNECDHCVSITNGSNLDVLEIDGASNRGIDEIRDLREKVRLAPTSARKKVYIIDEVHMLTTEAFNALLKTLEEPPAHVMFIFCTTEVHRVPPTILSRCFHIPFKRATDEELVRSFRRIAEGEKIQIDDEALSYIASLSDGGFRDGAKILEEMSLLAQSKDNKKITITKELIEEKYHVTNIDHYTEEMIRALSQKNVIISLELVQKIFDLGIDMKYFIQALISSLHKILLAKVGIGERKKESELFEIDDITHLIELLSGAYMQIKNAVIPQLPLEIVVIEWCLHETSNTKQVTGNNSDQQGTSTKNKLQKEEVDHRFESKVFIEKRDRVGSKSNTFLVQLIEAVKRQNQSLAGVLRGCELGEFGNGKLVIETRFKFHKERLSDPKALALINQVAEEVGGQKLAISVLLKG